MLVKECLVTSGYCQITAGRANTSFFRTFSTTFLTPRHVTNVTKRYLTERYAPCNVTHMIYEEPQLPEEVTDTWAMSAMREVRDARADRGFTFRRFVQLINAEGYDITLSDYKHIEQYPANSTAHVRAGLLAYAYRALNSTRTPHSVQSEVTASAMRKLAAARLLLNLSFADVAAMISERGINIHAAEYRTAEQGITRQVPYDVVLLAAEILGVEL